MVVGPLDNRDENTVARVERQHGHFIYHLEGISFIAPDMLQIGIHHEHIINTNGSRICEVKTYVNGKYCHRMAQVIELGQEGAPELIEDEPEEHEDWEEEE